MKNLNCRQLVGYSKMEKRLVMQYVEVVGKAPDQMEPGADSTLADRDKRSDLYKDAEDKAKKLEAQNVGDKDAKELLDQVAAARAFENKEPEAAIAAQQLRKSLDAIMLKGNVQPAKTEEKAVERPVQTTVEAKPEPKVEAEIGSTKPGETGASATDVFNIKDLKDGGENAMAPKPKAEENPSFATIEGAKQPIGREVIHAVAEEKQPDEK
ncbi:MAG: hypothetical protein WC843_04920 [Candidatus Gracilibacteria bacterium]|jgi:hypothetical protein